MPTRGCQLRAFGGRHSRTGEFVRGVTQRTHSADGVRSMTDDLVVLRAFRYEFEALIAQQDLEVEEIPSGITTDTWSEVARREFRLPVRRADVERALLCLADA